MQAADQDAANMQVGRAMHEAGLVARSGAGSRGPDESGDRVSAEASDADGRRSGLARQTPGTCRQRVRCGPYLAGKVLPAPSARVRKSGPSPAGGAVGVRVRVTHLNRVRAALTRATRRGEKSARCVGGWGWWSPPVGRRSGIEPASNPANLGMWVRKRWFPVTYAHATWHRLVPFFRLPGRVTEGKQTVWVELRPFNDRQLNLTCLTDDDSASPSQEQGVRVSNGQPCKVA